MHTCLLFTNFVPYPPSGYGTNIGEISSALISLD